MREHKYRGFDPKQNKFVYGSLVRKIRPDCVEDVTWCYLIHDGALTAIEVPEETVGEYTGLKDKNGVEVFEGDVFEGSGEKYIVEWNTRRGRFDLQIIYKDSISGIRQTHIDMPTDAFFLKVIGNIHENPELIIK